jgi:hypothetical protein
VVKTPGGKEQCLQDPAIPFTSRGASSSALGGDSLVGARSMPPTKRVRMAADRREPHELHTA